jgi:Flp pilus assembly protein TadG
MIPRSSCKTQRRQGAAAVELAILLPAVLVPLVFGIWEVGRLVQIQQIVANAAREGGRQASTGKYTETDIRDDIMDYLTNAGLSTSGVQITVTVTDVSTTANPPPPALPTTNTTTTTVTQTNTTASPPTTTATTTTAVTVVATNTTTTTTSTNGSASPVLTSANQFDDIRVDVSYPFNNIRYLAINLFVSSGAMMNATVHWQAVPDKPVVVSANIPQAPL